MRSMTRKQRQEQDLMELLRITYILIMPCVRDISGFHTMSVPKIYAAIVRAAKGGFITEFQAGQSFELQKRVALTNKGLHAVCAYHSLPLQEQACEGSHTENLKRLRLYEPVMRLAPLLFRSGAIATPFVYAKDPGDDPREVVVDESMKLVDIDWRESTLDSNVHVNAWYRNPAGETAWVPIVTVGLHHISAKQEERDRAVPSHERINVTAGQESVPAFIHGPGLARPLGVVFVVLDRLAGWFVARQYDAVPKAIVDAAGNVIRPMNPVVPMGRIERPLVYAGRVGLPENELERLLQTPEAMAMQGVPQRRVFESVNSYQGCNVAIIASLVRHPESKVKRIVSDHTDAGLLAVFDDCVYLSADGRVAAARRDRQHVNAIHRRHASLTSEGPTHRLKEREHEQAVARVADQFLRAGMEAFAGWRFEITYPGAGGTQLRPDLWVLVPLGDGTAMWHAVEVERSAAADASVDRKLGPSRTARDRGETWPMIVVAGKGIRSDKGRREDMAAAQNFAARGSDLPLLAMPYHHAMEGKIAGPEPAWLRAGGGETVPISYLRKMVSRHDLIQRLGDRAW